MKPLSRLFLLVSVVTLLPGCHTKSAKRELDPDLNRMIEVPRYDPYESSSFFEDGMTMRTPPTGTVPFRPIAPQGDPGTELQSTTEPALELSMKLLESGRRKFDQVCAACHGVLGDGDTVVATHMERPPPSLHQARLRGFSLDQIYRVISEGYGYMPSYATHLDGRQRWAVAMYVRALQLSQHAELDRMPAALSRAATRELSP